MSAAVTLKKGEGRTVKKGGMWIYDNEIASVTGDFENGDIVTVYDFENDNMEEYSFGEDVPVGIYKGFVVRVE